MCSRNQFMLFHLFYTTDEGNYKLWKIRHILKSKQAVSLVKRISNKFFQYLRSSPPASTRSLQLPFVFTWTMFKQTKLTKRPARRAKKVKLLSKLKLHTLYEYPGQNKEELLRWLQKVILYFYFYCYFDQLCSWI